MLKIYTKKASSLQELDASYHFDPSSLRQCIEYLSTNAPVAIKNPLKCVWFVVFYSENILLLASQMTGLSEEVEKQHNEIVGLWLEYLSYYNRGLEHSARDKARELFKKVLGYGIDPF